jgi:hypothetical protein
MILECFLNLYTAIGSSQVDPFVAYPGDDLGHADSINEETAHLVRGLFLDYCLTASN